MPDLKLIALDADDLNVISAHLQDAVLRVGDMAYLPRERRFAAVANRFNWERALGSSREQPGTAERAGTELERRRTGLRFERVLSAKILGLDLKDTKASLALLAIVFEPGEGPEAVAGNVTLTFSGGGAIRLEVECVEAEMKDLGAVWSAKRVPRHTEDKS